METDKLPTLAQWCTSIRKVLNLLAHQKEMMVLMLILARREWDLVESENMLMCVEVIFDVDADGADADVVADVDVNIGKERVGLGGVRGYAEC